MRPRPRYPNLYDSLGTSYRLTRTEDPELKARIHAALGGLNPRSVINVGAGTGSYEPRTGAVVAVEPSEVMIRQRPPEAASAVRATAEALPFRTRSFDAAMALWTIHHWTDPATGIAELRRVADAVVIVAASAKLSDLWLTRDYFPAMARTRRPEIQPEQLAVQFGGTVRIDPLPLPRDCRDGFGEAFWARPEAYLDPKVRAGMSAFRLLERSELEPGLNRLRSELASGAWDAKYGYLRSLDQLDCGHRLITARSAG